MTTINTMQDLTRLLREHPEWRDELRRELLDLSKLHRQRQERLAAVCLDRHAQNLLNALDRETSIRWEDLPHRADSDWSEASRAAALLVGANLCEVSPTRIRLSEYGDKLLAESSLISRAATEIATESIR